MRLTRTLATGAVALAALVTLTGCGSDESGGGSGGGSGSSAGAEGPLSKLPQANTMADVQKALVERGIECNELSSSREGMTYMASEAKDPAWGIKERAACHDGGGSPVTLLLIGDMAKFQTSLANTSDTFTIGQNFAVAAESDSTDQSLVQNGLLVLSCDQSIRDSVPSGFETHEGLVKGCFTTNHKA
ncbi:hypothetical protein [Streptomyces sp. NPDC047981]|uniref:hypothetical protein n=1 Tax=Streptomyces sp. NPDC047981 TaxID=3154610 RepID=UPI0034355051